jgi:hypothetical protein
MAFIKEDILQGLCKTDQDVEWEGVIQKGSHCSGETCESTFAEISVSFCSAMPFNLVSFIRLSSSKKAKKV